MADPLVSIIITTYNRQSVIIGAVESVLNQSYDNIEIIVVDDSSDYDIRNYLEDYSDHIEILINDVNMGANWSRSKGITFSSGDYIAFLDDDDRWSPEKIEEQIDLLEKSTDPTKVSAVGFKRTDGTVVKKNIKSGQSHTKSLLLGNNDVGGFSVILVPRSVIRKAGLPDIHLKSSQDLEWYIRLSKVCDFERVKKVLVEHHDSDEEARISDKRRLEKHDSYKRILEVHHQEIERHGGIFRRKTKCERQLRLSRFSAAENEFKQCRLHARKAMYAYPLSLSAFLLLFIGIVGNPGLKIARQARNKFKEMN